MLLLLLLPLHRPIVRPGSRAAGQVRAANKWPTGTPPAEFEALNRRRRRRKRRRRKFHVWPTGNVIPNSILCPAKRSIRSTGSFSATAAAVRRERRPSSTMAPVAQLPATCCPLGRPHPELAGRDRPAGTQRIRASMSKQDGWSGLFIRRDKRASEWRWEMRDVRPETGFLPALPVLVSRRPEDQRTREPEPGQSRSVAVFALGAAGAQTWAPHLSRRGPRDSLRFPAAPKRKLD